MESKGRQIQFGLIIVLFLSSLIVPVILLYPIQEMLYRPNEFYYFAPYFNAYIIFMVSLFVMALVLLINYLIIPKTKKKEYSTWSSVCFLINCLRFYRIKL